jgi:hypothetical protein
MYIINSASAIARHNHLDPISKRRAAFARDAVFAEFRPRDARGIDSDRFKDREPAEAPRLSPVSWRRETNGPKRVELADLIGLEAA